MASVKSHVDQADRQGMGPVDVESALTSVRSRMGKSAWADSKLAVVPGRAGAGHRQLAAPAKPVVRPQWTRWAMAVAAVAVVALSIRQWSGSGSGGSEARTVATQVGQRDSVTLSDGTRIVLAPGSQLVVAANFDAGDRVVELIGAAYFDVYHDEARPFTVHAAGAVIRDVGTAFTVKMDDLGGVSIAVTHGIVAVGSTVTSDGPPATVELHAGDRGTVSAGNVAVTRGIVAAEDAAWIRGQLSYRDAPLAEVQADLKRWYGITLRVEDSALTRLTVTMPSQPDSASVVRMVATMLGAVAEQRGDTVILRSAGSGTTP